MASPERWWAATRRQGSRALGPLAAARHGWPYVARRGVAEAITRAIDERPTRAPNQLAVLDALSEHDAEVVVHEVAPTALVPGLELAEPSASDPRLAPLRRPECARVQRVIEIPGGMAFGLFGWIGLDRRRLLVTSEMTRWHQNTNLLRRMCAAHADGRVERRAGRTAVLLQHFVGNYVHSLIQGATGLDAIDRAVGLDSIDRFLVRYDLHPFAREMLARFGIDDERVEYVPDDGAFRYECETLVATTFPDTGVPGARSVVEPLRRRFAPELASVSGPRRRWFVERTSQWGRRLLNIDDVRRTLTDRGFEPVTFDGRSVAEQASLMAQAEMVVGVHGAALGNIVFAPPGTHVVELMPANIRVWVFGRLSQAAGLTYDVVVGSEPAPPLALYQFLIDADLEIDVDELAARVDAARAT